MFRYYAKFITGAQEHADRLTEDSMGPVRMVQRVGSVLAVPSGAGRRERGDSQ